MSYTLLQANAFAGDLRDALRLLAGGDVAAAVTGGPPQEIWATVELPETVALEIAPRVATMLRRRVVVTTVDEPRCWLTLAAPTGEVVGPIDGRATGRLAEFASAFGDSRLPWRRRDVAWPTLVVDALADQQRPALARHVAAARVLGLPMPPAALDPGATSSRSGTNVVVRRPSAVSATDVGRRYRRRLVARRAQTVTGVAALAAGTAASFAWTDGDLGRLAVSGGVMAVLILVWLVLRRVLR